ncbi:DNA internalization-related competence protein ComEC/Rec2 [Staphylococcus simiae]|uniref:DNA internalization-related competence protein ComEC/Rec2 n=1 Tax=Staphylococcus simiae TaxID=308354 RepID=UPI001F60100F|nr:DNA internalization-related competence protein ComEC/Rec2 [Staphylococcus simiae]
MISILVGVFWQTSKILSLFILFLVIMLVFIKKKYIYIPCIAIVIITSSVYYYHVKTIQVDDVNYYMDHKEFKNRVNFISSQKIEHNAIKGKLKSNNTSFDFIYKADNKVISNDIVGLTCNVTGQFYSPYHEHVTLKIKSIDFKNCTTTNQSNILTQYREYINNKIKYSGVKYPERIMSLINGDTTLIDDNYKDNVKNLGIYHLLAVSGSHIAIIIFLIYQPLVRLNVPMMFIKIVTIVTLLAFAFYTNFAPSACRAIIMAIIVMLLPKNYKVAPINILSSAFVIMFLINPLITNDIGFQFSFVISFFIIFLYPYISSLSKLKSLIALTFIAQLSSLIVSIPHFNQLQWIGFFSNILFVPFYTFILFPCTLLFYIICHFIPHLSLLNIFINKIFEFHDYLLKLLLNINNFNWYIPKMSNITYIVIIISIVLILIFLAHHLFKYVITLLLILLLLLNINSFQNHHRLTMLNVGQGDSILFEGGSNQTVLIDTGGQYASNQRKKHLSLAKYHTLPVLKERGINKLNYLVLTHPHQDHIGELPFISSHIKIEKIIINSKGYPKATLKNIMSLCDKYNIQLLDVKNVMNINFKDTTINFLIGYIYTSDDKNEYSIVTLIKYRNINILLMGDATKNNENLLLKKYNLPKIDILKVGHHGSKTSSSEGFIRKIQPTISLISSGKHNRYHLPNNEVIMLLKSIKSKIYNTQQSGQITIDLDKNFEIQQEAS